MPQHPPPSQRLRRAGRNGAVGPDGYPLRVDRRRVGLEVTELLLLLGVQPPFTTSLLWRLVEAAVLVGRTRGTSQNGWHAECQWLPTRHSEVTPASSSSQESCAVEVAPVSRRKNDCHISRLGSDQRYLEKRKFQIPGGTSS